MKKKLNPKQKADRDLLIKALPNEDERMAFMMGMAKHASHLCSFIERNHSPFSIPPEILYRICLIQGSLMTIFDPNVFVEETKIIIAPFKEELSDTDIDNRFEMAFRFLYEIAKKKGWTDTK